MSTTTYTTIASDPRQDAAFEAALGEAREAGPRQVLAHRIGAELRAVGPLLERPDPCDPARILTRAHTAGAAEVTAAVAAARSAQPAWGALPYKERNERLRALCALIDGRSVELAGVMSAETGKSRTEALAEIAECSALVESYCEEIERHDGYRAALGRLSENEHTSSVFRPYGVFAVIAPFNFPAALAWNMVLGALVTGNAAVLKPAEQAPWSGALVGELASEAGLPDGLLNVVHGDAGSGQLLLGADVDGVAFTGSASAGHAIARRLHEESPLRPLVLEMGGKNPALVTASADLDEAAEGIVRAAFGLSGQKCSACSRAIVEREVHDDLLERIVERTGQLELGDPARPEVFLGPVIDVAAVERYRAAVAEAERDGRVAAGGEVGAEPGYFVPPAVVCDLPRGHRLTREELFLPFVSVTAADGFEDALAECNAVEYGLAAGIFTADPEQEAAFLDRAEAGVLYVNRRAGATTGAWPGVQAFCGWKRSGASGKGGLGPNYLPQFMREQSRTIMRDSEL
jgi:1-pyrroline-5-carboxylate dehydrogenase